MLYYAALFFVIALVAALFGFGGIAAGAAEIAKILFFIFLVISIVAGFFGFTGVAAGAASIAKILFFLFLVVAIGIVVFAVIVGKAVF